MNPRRIKEFFVTQFKIIMGNRFGVIGTSIIVFFCVLGLLAPVLAPHQPWDTTRDANGKLAIMRPPSLEFPLGTTALGRDILSQMLYATRTTVLIGLVSGLISILIGANIGLLSGYYGGRLDVRAGSRFGRVISPYFWASAAGRRGLLGPGHDWSGHQSQPDRPQRHLDLGLAGRTNLGLQFG